MSELVPIPSPGVPMFWGEPGDPLVILVHDWYGRLPWLESYAQTLAGTGVRVAAPDLYNGFATNEQDNAAALMGALDLREALAELDRIVAEAAAQGSTRVGLVGFSMGGWLSLLHAQGGSVDAVVSYYATLAQSDHGVIPCPVLLHLAEEDEWGPGEDPASFMLRLRDHGTPVSSFTYDGTVHGFANASIPATIDTHAAALAFARTESFLRPYLHE